MFPVIQVQLSRTSVTSEIQGCFLYEVKNCVKSLHFLRAEVQNKLHQDKDYPCEVVGSWTTWYGEQDQAGKHKGLQHSGLASFF